MHAPGLQLRNEGWDSHMSILCFTSDLPYVSSKPKLPKCM